MNILHTSCIAILRFILTRGTRIGTLVLLVTILASNRHVSAQDAFEDLFLDVSTNGKTLGLIGEFSYDPLSGKLFARGSQLIGLGVRGKFKKNDHVDLSQIPGLVFELDYLEQTIALQLTYSAMQPNVLTPRYNPDFKAIDPTYGAGLNYEMTIRSTGSPGSVTKSENLAFESWAFAPLGTIQSTGFISNATGEDRVYRRLETSFESVNHDKALRFTLGDATNSGLSWTRPLRFGGIQIRKDFSIRPDIVTVPLLSYEGIATSPSSVDVFIENNRVFSTQTDEGPYVLEDVPAIDSNGNADIVITDILGNRTRVKKPFFTSSRLLKKGLLDFSISAGKARLNFGLDNNLYSDTSFLTATMKYGITSDLTFIGHLETTNDLIFVGGGVAGVLFNKVSYDMAIGTSRYANISGLFAHISFETKFDDIRVTGSMMRSKEGTADLAYVSSLDAHAQGIGDVSFYPRALDSFSIGIPVLSNNQALSLTYARKKNGTENEAFVGVGYTKRFPANDSAFSARVSYDLERDNTLMSVGFSKSFGDRTTGSVRSQRSKIGETAYKLSLSRPISGTTGDHGYNIELEQVEQNTKISARTAFLTKFGKLGTSVNKTSYHHHYQAQFSGSLVMAQGKFFAGNTIDRSFAIVDTGLPQLPIYHDGREVTQTNRNGRALVTNLSPFLENQISVSLDDVDTPVSFQTTGVTLVPGIRTGVAVELEVSDLENDLIAILTLPNGQPLPVGSDVTLNKQANPKIVGYDGVVSLSDLRKINTLVLTYEGASCEVEFEKPSDLGLELELTVC